MKQNRPESLLQELKGIDEFGEQFAVLGIDILLISVRIDSNTPAVYLLRAL